MWSPGLPARSPHLQGSDTALSCLCDRDLLLFGSDGFSFVTELPVVFLQREINFKEVEQVEES